jgi:hypothetical protein
MKNWFRGKRGGLISFLAIAALVAGGLGWVTAAALRLEWEQQEAALRLEQEQRLRLALWRLDSLVSPAFAKEMSRPYQHYSAVYAPAPLLRNDGLPWPQASVLQPSPLLNEELPEWMLMHFQASPEFGWRSPQVLSETLAKRLGRAGVLSGPTNVTRRRRHLQQQLSGRLPVQDLLARVRQSLRRTSNDTFLLAAPERPDHRDQVAQADKPRGAAEFTKRFQNQQIQLNTIAKQAVQKEDPHVAVLNLRGNGEDLISGKPLESPRTEPIAVRLGPMVPLWWTAGDPQQRLLLVRLAQVGPKQVCQGIVLDWPRLQTLLAGEVRDLFPDAHLLPVKAG